MDEYRLAAVGFVCAALFGSVAIATHNLKTLSPAEQRAEAYKECMRTLGSVETTCKELAYGVDK